MWAILASGQSLNAEDVALVKQAKDCGKLSGVIAVSDVGIDHAPWADALVSHDSRWWAVKRPEFAGRKFCRMYWPGCEVYVPNPPRGCNSGLMAMQVARDIFHARKMLLLGFDMHGTHYFGKHTNHLKNTTDERFKVHIEQFDLFKGAEVLNCTKGSALTIFPHADIKEVL